MNGILPAPCWMLQIVALSARNCMSGCKSARAWRGFSIAPRIDGATTVAEPVMNPCARKSRRVTGRLCDPCLSGSSRPSVRFFWRDLIISMAVSSRI